MPVAKMVCMYTCVRWRDVVQELSVQHTQTEETLSLWKEYQHLSHQCSLLLPKLRHQWEDLCRPLPELDSRGAVHALQVKLVWNAPSAHPGAKELGEFSGFSNGDAGLLLLAGGSYGQKNKIIFSCCAQSSYKSHFAGSWFFCIL